MYSAVRMAGGKMVGMRNIVVTTFFKEAAFLVLTQSGSRVMPFDQLI